MDANEFPNKKIEVQAPGQTYHPLYGFGYVLGVSENGIAIGHMDVTLLGFPTVAEWMRKNPVERLPPHAWKVTAYKDRGAAQHYRYHVQGHILDTGRDPQPFSWSVPDLAGYDMTAAQVLS